MGKDETFLAFLAASDAGAAGQAAFGELVTANQPALRVFLRRYVGDQSQAEDIAQEAFLLAYKYIGQFKGQSSFRSWLTRIAIREAGRAGKKQNRQAAMVDDLKNEEHIETKISADQRYDLHQALAKLKTAERAALLLCDGCGMSHGEAAKALDTPLGSVKTYVARARQQMRALMEA